MIKLRYVKRKYDTCVFLVRYSEIQNSAPVVLLLTEQFTVVNSITSFNLSFDVLVVSCRGVNPGRDWGRDPHIFGMGVMGWVREILLYPVIIM